MHDASDWERVDLGLESTAMASFVADVAAQRAGVAHTVHRVSGRKEVTLLAFCRAHPQTDRVGAPVLARMHYRDLPAWRWHPGDRFTPDRGRCHAPLRMRCDRQRVCIGATCAEPPLQVGTMRAWRSPPIRMTCSAS